MGPTVILDQSWPLVPFLWEIENMTCVTHLVLAYEEKGETGKWIYRARKGVMDCIVPSYTDWRETDEDIVENIEDTEDNSNAKNDLD